MRLRLAVLALCSVIALLPITPTVATATNGEVYVDSLANGWFDWSWDTTVNLHADGPTLLGNHPLAFTYNAGWAGLNLHTRGVDTTGYTYLQFVINGGSSAGQPVEVLLYDANQRPIFSAQTLSSYIQGGSIAAGQWRRVRVPLADLGGANRVIGGILIQDISGHRQPTMYLAGLGLVTADAGSSPAPSAIGGPQPFHVAGYPSEYQEAKAALQWLPQIKRAVDDAINAGLLNTGERQLWENILLGQVGVESVGQDFIVPNPSAASYSQGLTQLTYPTLYREENPFDPLTNLRTVMRTTIRYYRKWGNRWDRAVAQYLIGSENEATEHSSADWNGTTGQMYVERIVNVVWQANRLVLANDVYPARFDALQATCGGSTCLYQKAPPWSIWDSPALPYNWLPPTNDLAYYYAQAGVDANVRLPIATNTWDAIPSWFSTTSPAPGVAAFQPRQPTTAEAQAYPAGSTVNSGPWQETYPHRTWSPGAH